MVSWLGETCVFTSCKHRHTPWNITDRHLVTLWDDRNLFSHNSSVKYIQQCVSVLLWSSLHVPEYAAPGIWRIWSLWSAGKGDLRICWWRTLGWDTWWGAWRRETGSERQDEDIMKDIQHICTVTRLERLQDWIQSYWLVGLRSALVTCVCSYDHHGFDLGGTSHNASDVHQMPDAVSSHVTNHFGFRSAWRFEVYLTVDGRKNS